MASRLVKKESLSSEYISSELSCYTKGAKEKVGHEFRFFFLS